MSHRVSPHIHNNFADVVLDLPLKPTLWDQRALADEGLVYDGGAAAASTRRHGRAAAQGRRTRLLRAGYLLRNCLYLLLICKVQL